MFSVCLLRLVLGLGLPGSVRVREEGYYFQGKATLFRVHPNASPYNVMYSCSCYGAFVIGYVRSKSAIDDYSFMIKLFWCFKLRALLRVIALQVFNYKKPTCIV